jgi:hypothetical protein
MIMSKKMHLSWHDIEMFLQEKIDKKDLVKKKDHYISEILEIRKDLEIYKGNDDLYLVEYEMYIERISKNRQIYRRFKINISRR